MSWKTNITDWYLPIHTEPVQRSEWDILKPNVILGCTILGVFILTATGNELFKTTGLIRWESSCARIPTVKLKNPGKAFFKSESRTSVTFNNKCFSHFFMVADLLSPNRCYRQIAKVKNYNLNVTEIWDSDFKNAFPGIFNFTVGILHMSFPTVSIQAFQIIRFLLR